MKRTRHITAIAAIGLLVAASGCSSSEGDDGLTASPRGSGDGEVKGSGAGVRGESSAPGADFAASADAPVDPVTEGPVTEGEAGVPAPPPDDAPVEPDIGLPPDPEPQPSVAPGTLTVGAWDDNRNLERFLGYHTELHAQALPGLLGFGEQDHRAARDALGAPLARTTLDVSLVIDTTGSMGDELNYLQTEFTAISSAIEAKYPNAEQRWSLVVYKDQTDEYVTRWFDFRDDVADFRARLAAQSPGGGGDFPEAADAALDAMNQLGWRSGESTARLAFWVADAPHHDDRAGALKSAIEAAASQGIHIYPVASSGIDELTELSMRSAAQLTFGRYLFLTDDSGVGGAHKEPSIPCYFVTRLDAAILRMVDIEMTGEYREPSAEEVLRTGGNPTDGACTLQSGQNVLVF